MKAKKYTVEEIERRAKDTRKRIKGMRGTQLYGGMLISQMRNYITIVEFLLKEDKRLQKKIDRLEKKE